MANDNFSIDPAAQRAGWYQDPEPGSDGQRWWNGKDWTAQTRPRPEQVPQWSSPPPRRPKKNNHLVLWLIGGLVAFLGFFAVIGAVFGGSGTEDDSPAKSTPARATVEEPVDNGDWAILACHDSIENQMKDPDSADYKNETATRGTGQNYTVSGMVNGANSYGGMTGFSAYTCTATLDADGQTMRATATVLE